MSSFVRELGPSLDEPTARSSGVVPALGARELLVELVAVASAASSLDLAGYEAQSADALRRDLVPVVRRLLAEAVRVHASLAALADGPELERAGDVGFLAAAHLRGRDAALAGMDGAASWGVLDACAGALRQIRKSVTAVERALDAGEAGSRVAQRTALAEALETRRRYADLADVVGQLASDPSVAGLRRVGTLISVLMSKPIWARLRLPDRRQLESLRVRVHTWLRAPVPDLREGGRIACDALGVMQQLSAVSRREELVAHDGELAERVSLAPGPELERSLVAELGHLRGRDPRLDALLARDERSQAAWESALREVGLVRMSAVHALPFARGA